jgi:hypothetical protein
VSGCCTCSWCWISPNNTTHFHVLFAHSTWWIQLSKHPKTTMTAAPNAAVSMALPPAIPPPSIGTFRRSIDPPLPPPSPINQLRIVHLIHHTKMMTIASPTSLSVYASLGCLLINNMNNWADPNLT